MDRVDRVDLAGQADLVVAGVVSSVAAADATVVAAGARVAIATRTRVISWSR